MKKLLQKAEAALGVDLDGDGHVGKPKQGGGRGGYSQPAHGNQQQQAYSQQPQVNPQVFGAPGKGHVKALLIGINYYGQRGQLSGCVNDVRTMQGLIRKQGLAGGSFQEVVLVDDKNFPGAKFPTKQEILTALKWLAANNRPGDTLFFHFSGHGGQQKDLDGDEGDGFDETIIPVDFQRAGQITDDVIFNTLVAPLAAGVRLTAVMDCCHSGTAMDLPFMFKASDQAMKSALDDPAKLAMSLMNTGSRKKIVSQLLSEFMGGGGGKAKQDAQKMCNGDVVMFSGCADSQTSADVANVQQFGLPPGSGPGGAGGACTNAMAVVLLRETRGLRFADLLDKMRHELKRKGYKQVPQVSSSKPIDLSTQFSFFGGLSGARVMPIQPGQAGWDIGHGPAPVQNMYHGNQPMANHQAFPAQSYPPQQQAGGWGGPPQGPPPGGNAYANHSAPSNPYGPPGGAPSPFGAPPGGYGNDAV